MMDIKQQFGIITRAVKCVIGLFITLKTTPKFSN